MKIWRMGLLSNVPMACLAVLLAFSGCEGTTDEDSSGVDSYFKNNPYQSAARDATTRSADLTITPASATASIVGQAIAFTVSGGEGAYYWGVSDNAYGRIESQGSAAAVYTCLRVGNNDVIVQDDGGHYATAHISPVTDAMAITPPSVSLSAGELYVSFAVSGGTPPYSWTSGNPAMGTVSYSASSSYAASYTAVAGAYGQNVITVIDAEGRTASATITKAP